MRNTVIFIVMLCSLFSSLPACAVETEQGSTIAKVVELDGLDKAFDAIPVIFESIASQRQLVSQNAPLELQLYAEIAKAIDLEAARKTVVDQLGSNADDKTLKDVLTWLESPLGRRISSEEIRAATEPDPTAMQRYLASLRSAQLSRERIELMQRFVAQKRMAETLAKITRNVTIAMLTGLSEGGDCPPDDPAVIEEELREFDGALLENMRQQSILSVIYAYRNITDNEMEQYMRYMTGESYQKYDGIIRKAIDDGMSTIYHAIGKKMAQMQEDIHPGRECNCTQ